MDLFLALPNITMTHVSNDTLETSEPEDNDELVSIS